MRDRAPVLRGTVRDGSAALRVILTPPRIVYATPSELESKRPRQVSPSAAPPHQHGVAAYGVDPQAATRLRSEVSLELRNR
jgi:hypothetical protein